MIRAFLIISITLLSVFDGVSQTTCSIERTLRGNDWECVGKDIWKNHYSFEVSGDSIYALGLPAGMVLTYDSTKLYTSSDPVIVTITGKPEMAGTYGYSLNVTGSCSAVSLSDTLLVTDSVYSSFSIEQLFSYDTIIELDNGMYTAFIETSDSAIANPKRIRLTNNSIAIHYEWYFGEEAGPTLTNAYDTVFLYHYKNSGIYPVTLIARNGHCLDTSKQTIYIGVPVSIDNNIANAISISPNPFTDNFNVQLEKPSLVTITNNNGTIVYSSSLNKGSNSINTSSFSAGIYFVEVSSDGKKVVKKVIKL